jgi:signal transduction histidine kinase
LNALIVDVIKDIEITVVKHKITYERHGPILVYADAEKISSVISNLISNALKYSPKGTRIEISCETNPDVVQVNVSDEGVGISKKDQEQLFERYYRVNDVRTTNVAGFGIGLYLSAEIVARHGGKIWVESESGAGSTFSFTLPLHELI